MSRVLLKTKVLTGWDFDEIQALLLARFARIY